MIIIYPDLQMTREDVAKKFQNMYISYKKIKNRNIATGRNTTCWEHYDDFEQIYGTKHPVDPLETENIDYKCANMEENEILKFLKKDADKENRRHEEMMTLEREKLKVVKAQVEALIDHKSLLEQFK